MTPWTARLARRVCRLYPFFSGCGTLANRSLLRRLSPAGEVITTLRDGSRIRVRPADYIGRALYFFGDFDPKLRWVFDRLLRPGDVVLDVGANFGAMTLFAARRVGPTGAVHAFEPQPDLAEMLRASAALNGYDQVHVHSVALSDKAGRFDLHMDGDNSGSASLGWHEGGRAVSVEVVRGEKYLDHLGLPPVRLLKVDVEGHEADLFRGAAGYLSAHPPAAVMFESHDARPWPEQPAAKQLADWSYDIWEVPWSIARPSLRPLTGGTPPTGHDFVAVHRGPARAEVLKALKVG